MEILVVNKEKLLNLPLANHFGAYVTDQGGCLKCVFLQACNFLKGNLQTKSELEIRRTYFEYFGRSSNPGTEEYGSVIVKNKRILKILDKYEEMGYQRNLDRVGRNTKELLLDCITELEEHNLIEYTDTPQTQAKEEKVYT